MTVRRRGSPHLLLTGSIAEPRVLDRDSVLALGPLQDTGPVGFIGEAVPFAPLLREVAIGTRFATVVSDDGHYRASIPLVDLERALLVLGRDGAPLSRDDGGPFRLVVPDGRTLCWNVKAVSEIRFTSQAEPDSVPEEPTH